MKIPVNATIAREKLTHYLLVPKPKNDKSRLLARIGFTQDNPEMLDTAIRKIITANEAILERQNEYGALYQVIGDLRGPHGILAVVTIWIRQETSGKYHFVTLKSAR